MRKAVLCALSILIFISAVAFSAWGQSEDEMDESPAGRRNAVLDHAFVTKMGLAKKSKYQQNISSSVLYTLLEASGEFDRRASMMSKSPFAGNIARNLLVPSTPNSQGCQMTLTAPSGLTNIRVNQDCSLRRQAEEVIAINPTDPLNLIAGANDSRIGFNHCGYAWSLDGGKNWGDLIPPFYDYVLRDNHTADVCSDPTATFDADGNAYIGGILWDINAPASALVVAKSNAAYKGQFYHSPSMQPFQSLTGSPLGVVASNNNPNIFNDKDFIIADANMNSPKKNNVYAAWTRFNSATGAGVKSNSPIYFSQSSDGGATWSAGIAISGANAAICRAYSGGKDPHACDQNQGADPIVGPDGTIYVTFNNANTRVKSPNQFLVVSCPPTRDCSVASNWTSPVKISDDFAFQPFGDKATSKTTGCTKGDQCLPPNGYRVNDSTSGSISVDRSGRLYFVWSDFRNGGGTCTGPASTATPPCNNDVFYSFSTDGGRSWSIAQNITAAGQFGQTAQWMPWSAVSPGGSTLWVAFYDRSYGSCEASGCNDITLTKIEDPATASPEMSYQRITTSSMPDLNMTNNPYQAGFLGDYMWVTSDSQGSPYVVWADTRGLNGNADEDVYFSKPQ